jgi:dTDP-4-dehydrorhamnose 3,5-epimerase
MKVTATRIPDVKLIEPRVFADERGFFMETWNAKVFREAGIDATFVQDNHSRSVKNTLRGLHYQLPPHAQGKLVRVTAGKVFDVAVDIRRGSPTFGQWVGVCLSEENHRMLWVPPGLAHGFLVTSETADFQYKCTAFYAPTFERTIRWDDPQLAISWPVAGKPLVSDKDAQGTTLAQAELSGQAQS